MNALTRNLRPALSVFVLLSAITGIVYPLIVTALSQAAFPHAANGSVLLLDGRPIGSALIGQSFSAPGHFWGRPSATAPMPDNGLASGGSNLGSNNPALIEAVHGRIQALRAADPGNTQPVPVDLVTASASGLDPQISLAGALYQVPRVARARGMAESELRQRIDAFAERPAFGVVGEPRVNVLLLNLALDGKAVTLAR